MGMDPAQFERFLEAFEKRMQDHDLLVRIETTVKLNYEGYLAFKDDIQKKQEVITKAVSAAHRRVDWLMVGGFITIMSGCVAGITLFVKGGA